MKRIDSLLSSLGRGLALVLLLIIGVTAQAAGIEGVDIFLRRPSSIESVDKALKVYKAHRDSGERFEGDPIGMDYQSVSTEWKAATIQTNATGDVAISGGPALVKLVRVRNTTDAGVATAATAGIILVKNGGTIMDGAAAGKTAGQTIYDGADGTMFRIGLVLNFANAADNPASNGKVEVLYRRLDPRSTY